MKLTATFIALAAARDLAMGSQSANLVVGDDSMGAGIVDHTTDDMYNQLSKAPTPAPSGDSDMHDATHVDPNIVETGDTTQIDEQTGLDAVPTAKPTSFPTKIQADKKVSNNWIITKNTGKNADKACYARLSADGDCILDDANDNMKYKNNEECTIKYIGGGTTLKTERFNTERSTKYWYDWMKVTTPQGQATKYDSTPGYNIPQDLYISKGTKFHFKTDRSITRQGFKLCVPHIGSTCTATYKNQNGKTQTFQRPVGWVGAGPGKDYCNMWSCNPTKTTFKKDNHFNMQKRQCSVEEHGSSFCSHTTCTFSGSPRVIQVHSDHREEVGGMHKCGFSKHAKARDSERPGCDCICMGDRRQDANGFTRRMHAISQSFDNSGYKSRGVVDDHDATTDASKNHNGGNSNFDATNNANNFYSQHNNIDTTDKQRRFANANANQNGGDGTTVFTGSRTVATDRAFTQYNEGDQGYEGQRVAHVHIDN